MTSEVCLNWVVPLWLASAALQRWFNARHTCSRVISGFFPPESLRVQSHERHHQHAQQQVPHQPAVVPPLVVPKADLALGYPDAVLDLSTILPSKMELGW